MEKFILRQQESRYCRVGLREIDRGNVATVAEF